MEKYVAYYRVSTTKQGLEAQKTAVLNYTKCQECVIAEFVESGKKNNRVELTKALDLCKQEGATLVVAKLSRNLTFISALMDSKVKFICCDTPQANELNIHIFAVMALISVRTKDAFQSLKKKYGKIHHKQAQRLLK